MRRVILGAIVVILGGYLGLCALLYTSQRSLIYYPRDVGHNSISDSPEYLSLLKAP